MVWLATLLLRKRAYIPSLPPTLLTFCLQLIGRCCTDVEEKRQFVWVFWPFIRNQVKKSSHF
jgi:hypothetical protein